MEGLAILFSIERAYALNCHKIICELDSQIIVNLLIEKKLEGANWNLVSIVRHILHLSSRIESISFTRIPSEWNRVVDCLVEWAFEHANGC